MPNYGKVNVCGIPEDQWVDGKCIACGKDRYCEMLPSLIVDARAYQYAGKHSLLRGVQWDRNAIMRGLEDPSQYRKAPKYLREALSAEGKQFSSLEDFPVGTVLRCCRDSKDGTFRVGCLAWRSALRESVPDGINIRQEAACLDAEFCSSALVGAHFEETFLNVSDFER